MPKKAKPDFVPEAEQPYKIPHNWRWVQWGEIGTFTAGNAFKNEYQGFLEYKIPFYKVGSLKYSDAKGYIYDSSNTINEQLRAQLKASLIPSDSLIFAKIGEAIKLNRRSLNAIPCCIDNNLMAFTSEKCLYLYAYYWSISIDLYNYAHATMVPSIRKSDLQAIPFPLPPLTEQQRIVDRIESLFTKLDAAREKAREVVDGFELRKAVILHRAFSGELTRQWREDNGISFDSWLQLGFDSCVEKMQNGLAKRKGTTGNPVVVLRLANLSDDGFLTDDLREIVLDEKEQSLYLLNSGDILMIRVNGSKENVGKQFLITNQNAWAFCDHIIRIKCSHDIQPEYMVFFSKSKTYKQYMKSHIVSSAGQNTISRRAMADLTVPVPTMKEQGEIVRLLSGIFEKEQEIKDKVEQVIDNIDAMKKALLGRAFRGELGTNDPSEASPDFAVTVR